MIHDAAHPDVNLIWGVAYDENLKDEMVVTVIATGFETTKDLIMERIGKDSEARETVPPSAAEAKQEEAAEAPIQQAEASPKSEYRFKDEDDDDKYLEDLLNMFRRKK